MRKPRKLNEANNAVIWALKHYGDINQNYQGGNATKELEKRLNDAGIKIADRTLAGRCKRLAERDYLTVITSGKRTLVIRLKNEPADLGPNPFTGLPSAARATAAGTSRVKRSYTKQAKPIKVRHVMEASSHQVGEKINVAIAKAEDKKRMIDMELAIEIGRALSEAGFDINAIGKKQ